MASRKLTALPTATEVTTSDKIYIVDVSDTTESPQGTSKQATVEKVIGYKELVMLYTSANSSDNGTLTILKQDLGFGTITATRSDNQVVINSDTTPFTDLKTFSLAKFVGDDSERVLNYVDIYATSAVNFNVFDVDGGIFTGQLGVGANLNCKILIQVYP